MIKWIAKAIVQKTISFLPNPERANLLFQRYVTKGVELSDEHFTYKITHARDHINYLRNALPTDQNHRILELGTGWYPIVPMAFYLTDSGVTTSVDIQNWLAKEGQIATIRKMMEWDEKGKLRDFLPNFKVANWNRLTAVLDQPHTHTHEIASTN